MLWLHTLVGGGECPVQAEAGAVGRAQDNVVEGLGVELIGVRDVMLQVRHEQLEVLGQHVRRKTQLANGDPHDAHLLLVLVCADQVLHGRLEIGRDSPGLGAGHHALGAENLAEVRLPQGVGAVGVADELVEGDVACADALEQGFLPHGNGAELLGFAYDGAVFGADDADACAGFDGEGETDAAADNGAVFLGPQLGGDLVLDIVGRVADLEGTNVAGADLKLARRGREGGHRGVGWGTWTCRIASQREYCFPLDWS